MQAPDVDNNEGRFGLIGFYHRGDSHRDQRAPGTVKSQVMVVQYQVSDRIINNHYLNLTQAFLTQEQNDSSLYTRIPLESFTW